MDTMSADAAKAILEDLAGRPLDLDDVISNLDIDSLTMVEWVFALEEQLGVEITEDVVAFTWNDVTVGDAIGMLLADRDTSTR